MKLVAAEITRLCSQRWNGNLGISAGNDSFGGKAGIWRAKFDGVRCAVLLLTFQRVNKVKQSSPVAPGALCCAVLCCAVLLLAFQRVNKANQSSPVAPGELCCAVLCCCWLSSVSTTLSSLAR